MKLIDTHAHLHDPELKIDGAQAATVARAVGVEKIITIGTDAKDSALAVQFANNHSHVWASVGLHPHHADQEEDLATIDELARKPKVVAIGECGLDYYYMNSPKTKQRQALTHQLRLAQKLDMPVSIHIRGTEASSADAYAELWKIFDKHPVKGVIHSFSAHLQQMEEAIERGLYIALNGIMTFSKDPQHELVARDIPLKKLVLETDAPFLTPNPFRGTINEPKNVELTAAYIAEVKGVDKQKLAIETSANAETLFFNE